MSKRIWVSWEKHRRSESLSRELGAQLFQIEVSGNRLLRYLVSLRRTFSILRSTRPAIVFVQNPSVVLALTLVGHARMGKKLVIVDAHNAGVIAEHRWPPIRAALQAANRLVVRMASLTIVTNASLARVVERAGGRPFVLPDPLPVFPEPKLLPVAGKHSILYICTFSDDEPFREVIEAARLLPAECTLYISGRNGKKIGVGALPQNVSLTGYLPDDAFVGMLHSVDVVMDLTLREDCLLCGAYEALAAGKPMILSDTGALREYFGEGALYTDNSPMDIANKITQALDTKAAREDVVLKIAKARQRTWEETRRDLEIRLSQLSAEIGQARLHPGN